MTGLVAFLSSLMLGLAPVNAQDWGTYRPNLYFGTRAKAPNSPLFGMMWWDGGEFEQLDNIRHDAENRDGLEKFGYLEHNGDTYGKQELLDSRTGINLTTWFVQDELDRSQWMARVQGEPWTGGELRPHAGGKRFVFSWYVALADDQYHMGLVKDGDTVQASPDQTIQLQVLFCFCSTFQSCNRSRNPSGESASHAPYTTDRLMGC
jgi:hypothetical protein